MQLGIGFIKRLLLFAAILVFSVSAQSCAVVEYSESSSWIMGTLATIKCPDEQAASGAMEALRGFEAAVNAFEDGVNAAGFFPASENIDTCLSAAQRVSELSGGAFNIAVYEAMQVWGLIENEWQQTVEQKPEELLLKEIVDNTAALAFTQKDGVYYFNNGAKITLGGVAKGTAGDIAAKSLRSRGVESAIINLGGNVVLIGKNGDKPWSVGITDPYTLEPALKILVEDTTVTTAGAYERYVIIDGVEYGHIIDPATASPYAGEVLSATILCRDGAFADALATAVFIMGAEDGLALIESLPETEAILMLTDYTVITSTGAPEIEVLGGGWQVEK